MWRPVATAKGAIHNVARLKAMDLGPCYVIAVSETTLSIIQNYATDEIGFLSRYGVAFDGGYYTPVDESHPDYDFVLDTIRRYRLEVNDLTCDLVAEIARVADALEKSYDAQYVNIDDLIEVLPGGAEGKWGKWLSVLGEYSEALNFLVPGLNLQLPKTDIFTMVGTAVFRKRITEGINDVVMQLKSLNVSTSGLGAQAIIDELITLLPQDELVDWVLGDLDESISSISGGLITTLTGNYVTNKLDDVRNSINGGLPPLPSNYVTNRLADLRRELEELGEHQTNVNVTINQEAPSDGTVTVGGEDDQFPDQSAYFDAKCSAANGIYDTIDAFIDSLDNSDIESEIAIGGVMPWLSYKLSQSGAMGWAISKVSSFVTGIAMKLLGGTTISFADIASALSEQHSDLVLALYNASNATIARPAFLAALGNAATSLTATESGLVADLLTNDLINQLFDPRSDVAGYTSPSPISCSGWSHTFDFTVSNGGWTAPSFGNYVAGVGWQSDWAILFGVWDERLTIQKTGFTPETLSSMSATYTVPGPCGSNPAIDGKFIVGAEEHSLSSSTPFECNTTFTYVGIGPVTDADTIEMGAFAAASSESNPRFTLTSIIVTGSGTNPF